MVRSHARHPRLGFRPHRPETRSGKGRNGTSRHGGGGGVGGRFSGSEWYRTIDGLRARFGLNNLEPWFSCAFHAVPSSLALENRRFLEFIKRVWRYIEAMN